MNIGIPNAGARLEILQLLLAKMPNTLNATDIRGVADKCHGYVGADIAALVREAGSKAIHRWIAQNESGSSTDTQPYMSTEDLVSSLADIRPSAMREIFLEPPRVPWSAIGGQAEVKQKLKECVEWPLTRKHVLKRLGVEAPRGVLLYGPPGCSKTLMAKALATEGGLNFMAVKGPEVSAVEYLLQPATHRCCYGSFSTSSSESRSERYERSSARLGPRRRQSCSL